MTPPPHGLASPGPVDATLLSARSLVNRVLSAIFVALVIIAIAFLSLRYAEAVRDGRRNAENLAYLLSEYVALRLHGIDGALFRIAADNLRLGGPEGSDREWATALRTITAGVPGLSSVVILDAEGTVRHATLQQILGVSWADRPIFQELAKGAPNRLVVDPPMAMVVGDQVLVPFGRALNDPHGDFIGAAIATLIPNQLREFLGSFDLGRSGVAWVLLPSGQVLFSDGAVDDLDEAAGEPPLFARDAPSAPDGFAKGPLVPGGADYLTAFRTSDVANLVVAVSIADENVLSSWTYEAIFTLIVIVVGGVLLFVAARRLNGAALDILAAAAADPPSDHPA